jgi:hypothetical protein
MRTTFWAGKPHVKRALCKPRRRWEFNVKMDNTETSCEDVSRIKFSGFSGTVL